MTNIEQKALELVREVDNERGNATMDVFYRSSSCAEALCRAVEQHEAFRQEVSDAVTEIISIIENGEADVAAQELGRFIITKPNPLVEAVKDILDDDSLHNAEEFSEAIRAALAKRGLEIREKE